MLDLKGPAGENFRGLKEIDKEIDREVKRNRQRCYKKYMTVEKKEDK